MKKGRNYLVVQADRARAGGALRDYILFSELVDENERRKNKEEKRGAKKR